ncbi:hypothetical protein FHG87_003524 [Trinorchestia longiramus]|nr:hypothetical protein FHG87_003524 [Trinorchestia longiramus]
MSPSTRATVFPQSQPSNTLNTASTSSASQAASASDALVKRTSYPYHHQTGHSSYHHSQPVLAPNTYTLNLVGTLGLALVIGVLIYDFIAYLFAVYRNKTESYSPYGRRVASMASELWEKKNVFSGLNPYLKGRSLEPFTEILDAISDAVHKWDDYAASLETKKNVTSAAVVESKQRTKKPQDRGYMPVRGELRNLRQTPENRSWLVPWRSRVGELCSVGQGRPCPQGGKSPKQRQWLVGAADSLNSQLADSLS